MPDSERLQHLRQQRALLAEQLALLDRQIALEAKTPAAATASTQLAATAILSNPVAAPAPVSARSDVEADALLAQLAATAGNPSSFSKSGCVMIFSAVMLAALVIVGVVYYFFYR